MALKASATLDIEVCDEEFLRCFTYTENWAPGFDVATYENGGGDDIIFVIQGDSILIKGFDHESEVSPHAQDEYGVWPGMYEGAPHELLSVLDDDTFEVEDVTFCYWRLENEISWSRGSVTFENNEDDGSGWLLSAITITPKKFIEYIESYYEGNYTRVTPERVHEVFATQT